MRAVSFAALAVLLLLAAPGGALAQFDGGGGGGFDSGGGIGVDGGGFNVDDGGFNVDDGGFNVDDGRFNVDDGRFNVDDGRFNVDDGRFDDGSGISGGEISGTGTIVIGPDGAISFEPTDPTLRNTPIPGMRAELPDDIRELFPTPFPKPPEDDSGLPGDFNPHHCLDCEPADPAIGEGTLPALEVPLTPRLRQVGLKVEGNPDNTQIAQCSSAVQSLRSQVSQVSPFLGNRMDGFLQGCLQAEASKPFSDWQSDLQGQVAQCLKTYADYDTSCLQKQDVVVDQRIFGRIGMLFMAVGVNAPQPTCTATLLSETTVITARHCYWREALGISADTVVTDAAKLLIFAPNPELKPGNGVLPPYVAITNEVTPTGDIPIELLDEMPPVDNDVIVLRLANPIPLEQPRLSVHWREANAGEQLTIVGYQELAYRRMLLEQLTRGEVMLDGWSMLNGGAFAAFMRADRGAMCIAASIIPGEVQHFCQSYRGTSGAPIFAGDLQGTDSDGDGDANTVTIIGLQSRGDSSDVRDKELGGPTNVAAAPNETILEVLATN